MAEREFEFAERATKLRSGRGDSALGAAIRKAVCLAGALVFGCLVGGGPAIAQSSSNGVYGGYVGSDAWANSINEEAAQRALMMHNLGRGGIASGNGVPVAVQIVFPPSQTGLDNITFVTLVPQDKGAHPAMAIAVHNAKTIGGTFIPKKDVRGGHSYIVAVDDSMGDRYPIGRIFVRAGGRQSFRIAAPLLTPGSPHYSATGPSQVETSRSAASTYAAPGTGPAYQAPRVGPALNAPTVGSGFKMPTVGPGFKAPAVGPGFVPPGSN